MLIIYYGLFILLFFYSFVLFNKSESCVWYSLCLFKKSYCFEIVILFLYFVLYWNQKKMNIYYVCNVICPLSCYKLNVSLNCFYTCAIAILGSVCVCVFCFAVFGSHFLRMNVCISFVWYLHCWYFFIYNVPYND